VALTTTATKSPATTKGKEPCTPPPTLSPPDLTVEADENESAEEILQR
jgi:hypothetical protein